MKNYRCLIIMFSVMFAVACFDFTASGQSTDDKNRIATMAAGASSVRWDALVQNAGATLTVAAPDGQVFRKDFPAGNGAEFRLSDISERLPDGVYTYELRLTPVLDAGVKEKLTAARKKGNDEQVAREMRRQGILPAQPLVQSGSFSILNGALIVPGALQEAGSKSVATDAPAAPKFTPARLAKVRQHHLSLIAPYDQVIPDDLIVQGSICAGLDCVNNENFGFDTIRMKENNTRLQFDDTSSTAGFATNNWQLRANNSASGGGSFLGFVDQGATGNSESGTIVFQVDAGAPANSLRVSSTGRVGVRTATPVLDVHANTTDTPAIRLEQNNSGGFTAQTWDIGANEANFFVRDVTGGSLLSFRIRPGAPTSSLDISSDGDTGVGIGSPAQRLHVHGALAGLPATSGTAQNGIARFSQAVGLGVVDLGFGGPTGAGWIQSTSSSSLATNFQLLLNPNGGNVGIGTTAPTELLSVNGSASKPGGGSWASFSDERLKTITGRFNPGLKAVMQLQPLRYQYKANNALQIKVDGEHVGFAAQSVQRIIPEAVIKNDQGYLLVNNDPIIWAMLNAIKEQQKEIDGLKAEVRKLRTTSRRRK